MKTSTIVWIVIVVIVVLGGILWFVTQSSTAPSTASQATTTAPVVTAATVNLGGNAQFPSFLTAANGMALYTLKSDKPGVSNCSGTCAAAWPPYTVSNSAGLTTAPNIPGTLATITRSDGTLQVTYNGMPLYFFVQDKAPGDVTGNGKDNFTVAAQSATTAQPQAAAARVKTTTAAPASAPTAPATPAYNY